MKSTTPTFQSMIMTLQDYWAGVGCLIWQPYHTELGAGTMNPATYLRVLGPEPWWVAYVEPSFRPADGRYGENPNRWQHYYQFQVILKPDPGNPQELYLDSLEALGIDPRQHDIRFVEDNWEAPSIGAWGLGWEVWLDGQEITQYTYFQQAGGHDLDPVSVEITYGLERIALALQGVDTFVDLPWDEHLTYGEVALASEVEFSRYNFEVADVERLRGLFDAYEQEAVRALEAGLVQPAHDYVMKCSHAFNLMDARGAVGVTERMALFGRMRQLSLQVADAYLQERERLGYPLQDRWGSPGHGTSPQPSEPPSLDHPADFLFELGTEELPAGDLRVALNQLRSAWPSLLEGQRLAFDQVQVLGTPRRLVLIARGLAPSQSARVELVKGPPADRAYDSSGNPTQAAQGFARSQGVAVQDLRVEELDGGSYVVAEARQEGVPAWEVLGSDIPAMLAGLRFDRSMRWNQSGVAFSRPIRWMVALHGEHIIPVEFAAVQAASETRLLRAAEDDRVQVSNLDKYLAAMEAGGIVIDPAERQQIIRQQVSEAAKALGGQVIDDGRLLEEVANLVEQPTVFQGSFDERFLALPKPVLVSVMVNHQRYFPVEADGKLRPHFIAVRNGGERHLEQVIAGNEKVIAARFADAEFFVKRDLERPLADYRSELELLIFETSLGNMLEKTERVAGLVLELQAVLQLSAQERDQALRAARLSKADLVTQMVVEMTSLQGVMGRIYALRSGEPEAVAQAIEEHYYPRFSGDDLPKSRPGLAVAVADRLDSLVGLTAAGMEPSGAGDPFALRRTAIGLLEILMGHEQEIDLAHAIDLAAELQPIPVSAANRQAVLAFLRRRLQSLLLARGHGHDAVEAVLDEQARNPAAASRAVRALEKWQARADWHRILDNYARCVRITRDLAGEQLVDPGRFEQPAEASLYQALAEAQERRPPLHDVDSFLNAFEPLVPEIESFFEEVLVMSDEADLRRNRLGLLQQVARLSEGAVNMARLEGF